MTKVTFGLENLGLNLERNGFTLETISLFALDVGKLVSDIDRFEKEYLGEKVVVMSDFNPFFLKQAQGNIELLLKMLNMNYSREIPASQELRKRYNSLRERILLRYGCV
jgi:hypothetical protein